MTIEYIEEQINNFKVETENLKKDYKPGDTVPVESFIIVMETLIRVMEQLIQYKFKTEGDEDGRNS